MWLLRSDFQYGADPSINAGPNAMPSRNLLLRLVMLCQKFPLRQRMLLGLIYFNQQHFLCVLPHCEVQFRRVYKTGKHVEFDAEYNPSRHRP
jgi:hypothetical protein